MTGGVHSPQREVPTVEHEAVAHRAVRDEAVPLAVAEQLRAGAPGQVAGAGRVVGMGVRDDHPAHRPEPQGGLDDGLEMGWILGPRIEHREFPIAQQVGVGARTRHPPGVWRGEAHDAGRKLLGSPDHGHRSDATIGDGTRRGALSLR